MNGTNQAHSPPPGSGAGGGGDSGGFENQIDSLLQLVTARARGEVGSEAVEDAITQLLRIPTGTPPSSNSSSSSSRPGSAATLVAADPPAPAATATASARSEKAVVEDDDDYDDLDDETSDRNGSRGTKRQRSTSSSSPVAPAAGGAEYDSNERGAGVGEGGEEIEQSKRWDELDAIPLGRPGSKMLVTFGDGRNPRPKTVEAALLVRANCDARHALFLLLFIVSTFFIILFLIITQ